MATEKKITGDYIRRVNQAIGFIHNNLDGDLNLASVSKIAHYSPFHFHRIFLAVVGEPLHAYILRQRIEKSTIHLHPHSNKTISEIALEFGFSSNSSYTKAFKKHYGISPTAFKNQKLEFSKIRQTDSKNGQKQLHFETYICNIDHHKNWLKMNAEITVKDFPQMNLAYVSHVGPFQQIGEAYQKLMRWAGPRGLAGGPSAKMVTVYHDDPNVTEISKLRQSAAITIDREVPTEGEVSLMATDKVRCAAGKFEIDYSEFEQAWQSVFVWISEKGYEPSGKDCFEIYHHMPVPPSTEKCVVEICVPVN